MVRDNFQNFASKIFLEKEEAERDTRTYQEVKKYMFYESGKMWVK